MAGEINHSQHISVTCNLLKHFMYYVSQNRFCNCNLYKVKVSPNINTVHVNIRISLGENLTWNPIKTVSTELWHVSSFLLSEERGKNDTWVRTGTSRGERKWDLILIWIIQVTDDVQQNIKRWYPNPSIPGGGVKEYRMGWRDERRRERGSRWEGRRSCRGEHKGSRGKMREAGGW